MMPSYRCGESRPRGGLTGNKAGQDAPPTVLFGRVSKFYDLAAKLASSVPPGEKISPNPTGASLV